MSADTSHPILLRAGGGETLHHAGTNEPITCQSGIFSEKDSLPMSIKAPSKTNSISVSNLELGTGESREEAIAPNAVGDQHESIPQSHLQYPPANFNHTKKPVHPTNPPAFVAFTTTCPSESNHADSAPSSPIKTTISLSESSLNHKASPLQDRRNRDELPANLRNRMMKPTDCLLFAATLLEVKEISCNDTSSPPPSLCSQQADPVTSPPQSYIVAEDTPSNVIHTPTDVDVLCGRGGLINKHPGNIVYRKIVDHNKPFYQSVQKRNRILVSQSIVQSILNFGGRFLINGKGNVCTEIGYKRAVQKTSQALRERVNGDARLE